MMPLWEFMVIVFGVFGCLIFLFTSPLWLDRAIATFLRVNNIRLFPMAAEIAILITERPEQWSHDEFYMRHPDIGSIWTANAAYGLKIETDFGVWHPNWIERRIIRQAVDWRINGYVKNRIEVAMRRGALPH